MEVVSLHARRYAGRATPVGTCLVNGVNRTLICGDQRDTEWESCQCEWRRSTLGIRDAVLGALVRRRHRSDIVSVISESYPPERIFPLHYPTSRGKGGGAGLTSHSAQICCRLEVYPL